MLLVELNSGCFEVAFWATGYSRVLEWDILGVSTRFWIGQGDSLLYRPFPESTPMSVPITNF